MPCLSPMPGRWPTTGGCGMPCWSRCSTPANALPKGLRAQLAGLARVVMRECDSETPDLAFVAEMNEQISAGLWS